MTMIRRILHIDFDSFFASCEQQFNPGIRNKPMGVTATNGRTCIIASSREAKRLGIKTGTRTYDAKKICPDIIFIPADFVKYWEISKKFLNICKDFSPLVEVFSIDEVFMDITQTEYLFGGQQNIVQSIKERIKKEIGEYITVSIGFSHNKLLAKLASSVKKPNGFFEIKKDQIPEIYRNSKLTDICGIGERIGRRLNKIGIYNLLDLKNADINCLLGEFGKAEGQFLKDIGLAKDDCPLVSYTSAPEVKSVGRSYCLAKNEHNKRIILQNIYELFEEVSIKLRRLGKKARTIGIGLNGDSFIKFRKTFKDYVETGREIYNLSLPFFEKDLEKQKYVRQIHVWVSGLEDKKNLSLSLFDSVKRNDKVQEAVDKINDRFGDHTIRNGFLLYADKLTTVPNGYLADKYERIKLANESNLLQG